VVTVNYEFFDNQTVDSARDLVDKLRAGERPVPTRGAPLCTFKEIERQIAGLHDDAALAPDANGSGVPTEVGVKLAIKRGDTAPGYPVDDKPSAERTSSADAGAGQPTSAHDAPLQTTKSDRAGRKRGAQ
jgi:NADH-quinone oxidoreductase subunit E